MALIGLCICINIYLFFILARLLLKIFFGLTVSVMNAKRTWECNACPINEQFQISDLVHGAIDIFHPINLIIDTPEFQRLRRISQLGVCHMVYPSADHNRFCHSLGVYHLARLMVAHLARTQPTLDITPNDQLCVCIAALIHDLGHGPFSHMFELSFLRKMGVTDFKHEEMSCKVFKFMLEKNDGWLKDKLDEYLEERDYAFIEELVNPPNQMMSNSQWTLRGRPREKAFLYQIVSEPTAGLDVDKVDYLLRDSRLTDVSINLSLNEWRRILNSVNVTVDANGFKRICHPCKIKFDRIFESRKLLHECVYGHKTSIATEIIFVRALVEADPYLEFVGQNGKKYKMSTAHNDPQAFCRLDNSVISLVRYSNDARLDAAKKVVDAIDMRRLPKCVMSMTLNATGQTCEEMRKRIEADLVPYSEGINIIVKVKSFHHGKGVYRSPLKALFLFRNKDPTNILDQLDSSSPSLTISKGALVAFFYIDYDDFEKKEKATNALQMLIGNHRDIFWASSSTKRRIDLPNEEDSDWHFVLPTRKQLRTEDENHRA